MVIHNIAFKVDHNDIAHKLTDFCASGLSKIKKKIHFQRDKLCILQSSYFFDTEKKKRINWEFISSNAMEGV